jgi:type I restriction enzyme S subunit
MKWGQQRIEELCLKVTSGGTPNTRKPEYYGGNIPWLKTQEVDFNRIYNTDTFITEEGLKNSSAKWIPSNSVIIAMYGATAGRIAINKIPLTTNQACCNLIIDEEKADYRFIYYNLLSRFDSIANMAIGGAQQNLNAGMIKELPIDLPPLPTQKAIAEILSSLDDKIELNNQINQNLEALAQALFKQWFVEFEFPNESGEPYKSSGGEMIDSELGEIPKGWEVTKIGNVSKIIDCLHSKKPEISKKETGYLYLQLNNIGHDGVLDLKEKYWISEIDYKKWTSRIEVKEGDFVITNVGRSGAVSRITKGINAAIGRNMTAIRLLEDFPYKSFFTFLLLSDFMKNEIVSKLDAGTILDALNVRSIPKLRFFFNSSYIDKIEMLLEPIWNKIEANKIENHSLIDLRDTLLPKLISGELELNESLLEPTF